MRLTASLTWRFFLTLGVVLSIVFLSAYTMTLDRELAAIGTGVLGGFLILSIVISYYNGWAKWADIDIGLLDRVDETRSDNWSEIQGAYESVADRLDLDLDLAYVRADGSPILRDRTLFLPTEWVKENMLGPGADPEHALVATITRSKNRKLDALNKALLANFKELSIVAIIGGLLWYALYGTTSLLNMAGGAGIVVLSMLVLHIYASISLKVLFAAATHKELGKEAEGAGPALRLRSMLLLGPSTWLYMRFLKTRLPSSE